MQRHVKTCSSKAFALKLLQAEANTMQQNPSHGRVTAKSTSQKSGTATASTTPAFTGANSMAKIGINTESSRHQFRNSTDRTA